MNRYDATRIGLIGILLLVCVKLNVVSLLFTILVIGVIPGTPYAIPSGAILIGYPMLFIGVMYWLINQPLLIGETKPAVTHTALKVTRRRKKNRTSSVSAAKQRVHLTP